MLLCCDICDICEHAIFSAQSNEKAHIHSKLIYCSWKLLLMESHFAANKSIIDVVEIIENYRQNILLGLYDTLMRFFMVLFVTARFCEIFFLQDCWMLMCLDLFEVYWILLCFIGFYSVLWILWVCGVFMCFMDLIEMLGERF